MLVCDACNGYFSTYRAHWLHKCSQKNRSIDSHGRPIEAPAVLPRAGLSVRSGEGVPQMAHSSGYANGPWGQQSWIQNNSGGFLGSRVKMPQKFSRKSNKKGNGDRQRGGLQKVPRNKEDGWWMKSGEHQSEPTDAVKMPKKVTGVHSLNTSGKTVGPSKKAPDLLNEATGFSNNSAGQSENSARFPEATTELATGTAGSPDETMGFSEKATEFSDFQLLDEYLDFEKAAEANFSAEVSGMPAAITEIPKNFYGFPETATEFSTRVAGCSDKVSGRLSTMESEESVRLVDGSQTSVNNAEKSAQERAQDFIDHLMAVNDSNNPICEDDSGTAGKKPMSSMSERVTFGLSKSKSIGSTTVSSSRRHPVARFCPTTADRAARYEKIARRNFAEYAGSVSSRMCEHRMTSYRLVGEEAQRGPLPAVNTPMPFSSSLTDPEGFDPSLSTGNVSVKVESEKAPEADASHAAKRIRLSESDNQGFPIAASESTDPGFAGSSVPEEVQISVNASLSNSGGVCPEGNVETPPAPEPIFERVKTESGTVEDQMALPKVAAEVTASNDPPTSHAHDEEMTNLADAEGSEANPTPAVSNSLPLEESAKGKDTENSTKFSQHDGTRCVRGSSTQRVGKRKLMEMWEIVSEEHALKAQKAVLLAELEEIERQIAATQKLQEALLDGSLRD